MRLSRRGRARRVAPETDAETRDRDPLAADEESDDSGAEMDFLDHLEELRNRILRCLVYTVVAAMICVGFARDSIIGFVMSPAVEGMGDGSGKFLFTEPFEAMLLWLKIGLIAGLTIAMPFVGYELWAFIRPALSRKERRIGYIAILACPLLFVGGAVFIYKVFPMALKFLLSFNQLFPNADVMLKPDKVFGMMLTLMIGNGLCWQLPVVAAALGRLGILSSGFMLRYWRHAVVVIVTVAAVVTPTWDPVNLSIVALPMMVLYFASIGIVVLIERGNRARDAAMAAERHQRHLELDADSRRRQEESEPRALEAPEEAPSDEAGQPETDSDPTDRMNTD